MPEVGEVAELGATGTPESHLESDSRIAQPTEVEGQFANQRGCTHPYDSWRSGAHRSGMGDKAETPAVRSHILFVLCRQLKSLCVREHMYVYVHPCVWSKEISVDVSLITLYFVLKCVCVFSRACMRHGAHVGIHGQFVGVSSLLPLGF